MSVILHEIGHLFGLDHSSNVKSVMSPLFSFGTEMILPDDVRNLKMILGLETDSGRSNANQTKSTTSTSSTTTTTTTIATTTTTSTIKLFISAKNNVSAAASKPVTNSTTVEKIDLNAYSPDDLNNLDLSNLTSNEIDLVLNATSEEINDMDYSGEYIDEDDDYEELIHLIEQAANKTLEEELTKDDAELSASISTSTKKSSEPVAITQSLVFENENDPSQYVDFSISELTTKINGPNNVEEYIDSGSTNLKSTEKQTTTKPNKYDYINNVFNNLIESSTKRAEEIEETTTTPSKKISTSAFVKPLSISSSSSDSSIKYNYNETSSSDEKPADLCYDPVIDAITRTEWGNAFIFKGSYVWHIRGLTKWRLFDYEGWPKKINVIFPYLPSNIDSAYYFGENYFFTKVN